MPETFRRFYFIDFCSDHLKNVELWYCLSVLENHIYGVVSQNGRIRDGAKKISDFSLRTSDPFLQVQVRLDFYYYVLTWDKLRKVFNELNQLMNAIITSSDTVQREFAQEFRRLRRRIDHVLDAFHTKVRNEYEHPSFQPKKRGKTREWGSLLIDRQGNMTLHVGGEHYASLQQEHDDRLDSLWTELIDLLLKHFSDKPSSSDLLTEKQYVEDNIDAIIEEYAQCRSQNKDKEANRIIGQLLGAMNYLSTEGFPLRDDVVEKVYAALRPKSSGP